MTHPGVAGHEMGAILVVGGGIAGLTSAIEAAETGRRVFLVEKASYLGGRVAGFHQYFPKMCPPSCGLEINFRRINNSGLITVFTLAELESLSGSPGRYEAVVKIAPRFVTDACTICGECSAACPSELPDPFNAGMTKAKAIRLPYGRAFPARYLIDRVACVENCRACVDVCKYGAIDLHQRATRTTLQVCSVILATGWVPYDARRIDNLGYGQYANVITSLDLERLAAVDGPSQGKILRPSDGKPPRAVAFVQCAGSRDQNHLSYCSRVCCTASLKQANYVHSQYPEAKITIFYIDQRTPGLLEEFAAKVLATEAIQLIKGKVGKVQEHPATRDLLLSAEDIGSGRKITREYDLVVLAVGMVPQTAGLPLTLHLDEFGFISNGTPGVYAAGCVKRPAEVAASVRDATGAVLKAMQTMAGTAGHG